jgi:hypothetical protein
VPATTERSYNARVGNEHRTGRRRQETSYIFRFLNQSIESWVLGLFMDGRN